MDAAHDPATRLLIHAPEATRGWRMAAALHRLWACAAHEAPPPVLQIHDLRGRRRLALTEIGRLVDIALPPGTYHVTIDWPGHRRRYTVTLAQGADCELHWGAEPASIAARLNQL